MHIDESKYAHVMKTYGRLPVEFIRGEGVYLYDSAGTRYIDMVSGLGVVNVGHANPAVAAAAGDQLHTLVHTSNLYYTEPMGRLADRLANLSLGGKVFFANSGAEANEAAIKLARKHGKQHLGGANEIVCLTASFHGRTMATLSATGQPEKWTTFAPMLEGFVHVPINDIATMEDVLSDNTCAVLIEVVQGEGGVWPADPDWLQDVRRLCNRNNLMMIVDEVQSGMGRTGQWFAYQNYGGGAPRGGAAGTATSPTVTPDAITVAKGLANGLPIGALVTSPKYADLLVPGDHASTFGGGPVVCAAALAVLDLIEEQGLLERAVYMGDYLRNGLYRLAEARPEAMPTDDPGISGKGPIAASPGATTRGVGLMVALQLKEKIAGALAAEALRRGLLINAVRPDAIRFLPPLVITESQINEALQILEETFEAVEAAGQPISGG